MIIPKTKFILADDDFIVFLDVDGVLNSREFADWRVSTQGIKRRNYLKDNYEGILFIELLLLDYLAVKRIQEIYCKE